MGKRVFALLAALAVLAAVVVGCGGGDDDASLTKAEFIEMGNEVCARANQQFEDEFDEFSKERSLSSNGELNNAQLVEAAEEVFIPIIDRQLEELQALGVPEGQEQQVGEILSTAEQALQESREKPKSLLVQGGGPFAEANKLAKDYGLVECGEET